MYKSIARPTADCGTDKARESFATDDFCKRVDMVSPALGVRMMI